MDVWILLEACEGSWSPIFGVFSSLERASEALKLTSDPEIMTVIRVPLDEFKASGWWE
jgi:hypothetical protein